MTRNDVLVLRPVELQNSPRLIGYARYTFFNYSADHVSLSILSKLLTGN